MPAKPDATVAVSDLEVLGDAVDEASKDPLLLRIGLVGLIAVALVALTFAGSAMLLEKPITDLFVAIPSAAVGSIGTLLIQPRGRG